jgi:SAM-dependent methyltransferase
MAPSSSATHSTRGEPSPWVTRWAHLLPPGSSVLDVACGAGRHAAFLDERGHAVTGLDRDLSAIQDLAQRVALVQADIENSPWPLLFDGKPIQFQAVVVTNYLWRALFPTLITSLAPGGLLLYETFTIGNETVGRPSRPDFLLRPGELLTLCEGMNIVGYECGYLDNPSRFVQRIAAVRPGLHQPTDISTVRYPL